MREILLKKCGRAGIGRAVDEGVVVARAEKDTAERLLA